VRPESDPAPVPMVAAFPDPGGGLSQAYRELSIAVNGTKEQVKALGDLRLLPRPWDPATLIQPALRRELWDWLEDVVTWLNAEYVWDVIGVVPACWPSHPHLVHEIAVLADQRRRAGLAFASDALEEWHRYALPAFTERMRGRVKNHCEEGHQQWPAKGRYARHISEAARTQRHDTCERDHGTLSRTSRPVPQSGTRLHVVDDGVQVDTDTGEVID